MKIGNIYFENLEYPTFKDAERVNISQRANPAFMIATISHTYVHREWCWWRKYKILLLLPSIKEGGLQTNSILEWFNRTGNSLVGTCSIAWAVQHDAEDRRIFLNNAVGLDIHHHSGGRQKSLDQNKRTMLVVEAYHTMPKHGCIKTMTSKGMISRLIAVKYVKFTL